MSKKKIFIGMPLYEGNISHVTLTGIIDLIKWFSFKNIDYKFYFISKDSLVSRARNTIVTKFLDDNDYLQEVLSNASEATAKLKSQSTPSIMAAEKIIQIINEK